MKQLKILASITQRDGGVDIYLNQISKIPMITPDEETELSHRIMQGDKQALDRLVCANLRFVVSVAKQYQRSGMSLNDAIQDGNMGLMRAAADFDATRGFKFISYAVWWVRQSILQGLSESSRLVRLPQNQVSLLGRINNAISQFEQLNGRYPDDEEIAQIIDFPAGKIREVRRASVHPESMDAPLDDEADSQTLHGILASGEDATDRPLDAESLRTDIGSALMLLPSKERDILTQHYGLDGKGERTLEEIACGLGLTRERVRQIKERAVRTLAGSKAKSLLVQYC